MLYAKGPVVLGQYNIFNAGEIIVIGKAVQSWASTERTSPTSLPCRVGCEISKAQYHSSWINSPPTALV